MFQQQPLLWLQANSIQQNMYLSRTSWLPGQATHMPFSVMTMRLSTITWRRQLVLHSMLPLSNPINSPRMVEMHGLHLSACMLGLTSGKPKSRNRNNSSTHVWKRQSNFSLESSISKHHNAYVSMQACTEHVEYQLPNEHSCNGFLLEAIQNSDPGLQAAMASVRMDTGDGGKQGNFEVTAAHLWPYDPVARKQSANTKRPHSLISVDGLFASFGGFLNFFIPDLDS